MIRARPTETSAAAMTRTKMNITWPSGWPQRAPATTKANPAALSMISMDISTNKNVAPDDDARRPENEQNSRHDSPDLSRDHALDSLPRGRIPASSPRRPI